MTAIDTTTPTLLSVRQAAERLGVSAAFVWKRTNTREIPVVCLGRRRLIRPEDLQAFVDANVERAR
jgi:excisionase family DNA binding protein